MHKTAFDTPSQSLFLFIFQLIIYRSFVIYSLTVYHHILKDIHVYSSFHFYLLYISAYNILLKTCTGFSIYSVIMYHQILKYICHDIHVFLSFISARLKNDFEITAERNLAENKTATAQNKDTKRNTSKEKRSYKILAVKRDIQKYTNEDYKTMMLKKFYKFPLKTLQ